MTDQTRERIDSLAAKRQDLVADLRANPRGLSWCRLHTQIVDEAIVALVQDAGDAMRGLAVVATGGYGRGELSPHSDVDITVVPPDESSPEIDRAIRSFFQDLHHAIGTVFGLGIGYAYRLIADAPGIDAKTRTGLVDARLLSGPSALYQKLLDELDATMAAGRVHPRQDRRARSRRSPSTTTPRWWSSRTSRRARAGCAASIAPTGSEARSANASPSPPKPTTASSAPATSSTLPPTAPWTTLVRTRQEEIAQILGMEQGEMMSEIVLAANEVHQGYLAAKDRLLDARFSLSRSVTALRGEARITANADAGESAVGLSIATALGLRVSDLQAHPSAKSLRPRRRLRHHHRRKDFEKPG